MKDIIKRIQGFWQRLSGWQRYFLMIAVIYAIYTLIVVGIKFRFDHPHVMPKIEYGKIDDWQYDPTGFNAQVGNSAPQPFSGESVSRQWRRYLLVGLLIELFVSLPLLLVIKAVKNLLAGLHQIHKDARRLRQVGWANIMISLPTLIVLAVFLLALADAFGDFYIDSDLGAF
ncbi:hypothetical protein IJJ08_02695, partial [bacterium]|nr:hypothetical protein [bacterium]